jgi:hypothetical protein
VDPRKEVEKLAKEGALLAVSIRIVQGVCPSPLTSQQVARSNINKWKEKVAKTPKFVIPSNKQAWDAIERTEKELADILDYLDKCEEPETKEPQPKLPGEPVSAATARTTTGAS